MVLIMTVEYVISFVIVARDLIVLKEDFSQGRAIKMIVDGFFALLRMTIALCHLESLLLREI
ncbi:MAG TPA: hypothetical protein PLP73_03335 [Candidatus Absconditabacterales bacterium]|nr:hypothetical protein [Candidatus Absconditabacterales bacterium]